MSGHSKWAQIKHKKAKEDAKKGKIFGKLTRAIIVAAREGGGNPDTNSALANAIEKAKEFNLPLENIERAIKKGIGEFEGVSYETAVYEGYAVNGVAVMVDVMTDNKNRALQDIRQIFQKFGGSLGESGCVNWIFKKKGVISLPKNEKVDEDKLLNIALEGGAEDVNIAEDYYEIITDPAHFSRVKEALNKNGISYTSAEITMFPSSTVKISNKDEARKILNLIDALEENDDVQEVYSNFDIPNEILEELAETS